MLKVIRCLFVVIILQVLASCDTYSTKDLVSEGFKIKKEKLENFNELIKIANTLAKEPCVVYQVNTSRTTDYFLFNTLKYSNNKDAVLEDETYEYDKELEEEVRNNMPYENCTDFSFVKDLYVEFDLEFHRDKQYNYASIIYCMDKGKLLKLFPELKPYDNKTIESLINDSEHWIYFYDDKWAISTSSLVYKASEEDCNQIMVE